jgi:hypothetical protein
VEKKKKMEKKRETIDDEDIVIPNEQWAEILYK